MLRKQNAQFYLFVSVLVALMFVATLPSAGLCGEDGDPINHAALANVNGSIVSEADLAHLVAGQLQKLQQQEYEVKSRALDQLIVSKLLEVEASKQGITVDQLTDQQVGEKVPQPSDAEVEAYYLAQKDRVRIPLEEVRSKLRQALRQARIQQKLQDYVAQLRDRATIVVMLEPPRVQVANDPKRMRGNANAPVTIVEFSDFHCPFCKRVQPTLDEIMTRYEGKVRLTFRDMPLDKLHPRARAAAEAAKCAQDQGSFWEYHDVLFAQAPKASEEDLKQFAKDLGLDEEKFNRCVFANKHHQAVQRDIDEAQKLGITGTPAFFINGRFVNGAQPLEKFVQIIDEELARQPEKVSAVRP